MNLTQVAGSYIGTVDETVLARRNGQSNLVLIADGQSDELIGHIHFDYIIDNDHERNMQNNMELFNFSTFADKPYSEHLSKRNRIIIPGEDGESREFVIFESHVDRISKQVELYTTASYLDLKKSKVIAPHTTTAESPERHAQLALNGTEWTVGNIAHKGIRTLTFENYTNPFDYLKRIASEFDLELDFRIEHNGSQITGRYVDLVEQVGTWRGRVVEFGRDLLELRRIERTDNIVTALQVIGPEREDGTRLEVFVEDRDALQRWGRNGQHLISVYEPVTSDLEITEARLRTLGENELAKRINASVTYIGGIADLENVEGMENKKIRFGDTIRIKDTSYDPPLYLEARVFKLNRDIKVKGQKRIELGDYIEYTEDEVKAIWRTLQAEIRRKIEESERRNRLAIEDYTYEKEIIDKKDGTVAETIEKNVDTKLTGYVQAVTYDADLGELQKQIDGAIETHFYEGVPTLTNLPAVEWVDRDTKIKHVGDLYYDKLTGYAYRFVREALTFSWVLIRDEGIAKALQDAAEAKDTADSKRRVFVNTPYPPYDVGDLWDTGQAIKVCRRSKTESGSFAESDWEVRADVTSENDSNGITSTSGDKIRIDDGKIKAYYSSFPEGRTLLNIRDTFPALFDGDKTKPRVEAYGKIYVQTVQFDIPAGNYTPSFYIEKQVELTSFEDVAIATVLYLDGTSSAKEWRVDERVDGRDFSSFDLRSVALRIIPRYNVQEVGRTIQVKMLIIGTR